MVDDDVEKITPVEKAKAEKFLAEFQAKKTAQGKLAQTAIEDAIIARHRAKTGRTFHNRERDLQDALDWRAREDEQGRAKVKEFLRQQTKFSNERAAKVTSTPPEKLTPKNPVVRLINFGKGLIGRK